MVMASKYVHLNAKCAHNFPKGAIECVNGMNASPASIFAISFMHSLMSISSGSDLKSGIRKKSFPRSYCQARYIQEYLLPHLEYRLWTSRLIYHTMIDTFLKHTWANS